MNANIKYCIKRWLFIYFLLLVSLPSLCAAACPVGNSTNADLAMNALRAKLIQLGRPIVMDITVNRTYKQSEIPSLTIDDLRNKQVDDNPPLFSAPRPNYCLAGGSYDPVTGMCLNYYTDGYPDPDNATPPQAYPNGAAPYVASGVMPFDFQCFNNEFNDSGWHSANLHDYAVRRGFNIINPYFWLYVANSNVDHYPSGTRLLKSLSSAQFHWEYFSPTNPGWMTTLGYTDGAYGSLPVLDTLKTQLTQAFPNYGGDPFVFDPRINLLSVDLEHPLLTGQSSAYYNGYANTFIAPLQIAQGDGWPSVGAYGLGPFPTVYYELSGSDIAMETDPNSLWNWQWNNYRKAIHDAADVDYPSLYPYEWTPRNVAFVLANLDLNIARAKTDTTHVIPLRPYLWSRLHGGGNGWRWYKEKPMLPDDLRAIFALSFFAGIDGVVNWDWSPLSGDNYHASTAAINVGADVMVNDVPLPGPYSTPTIYHIFGAGPAYTFKRHDVLHILDIDADDMVIFQVINKEASLSCSDSSAACYDVLRSKPADGVSYVYDTYKVWRTSLAQYLLPMSASMPAAFEGLALIQPFEYFLRRGEVKTTFIQAQAQFRAASPVVRWVKLGQYHVLATYDPSIGHGGASRTVTLTDFDSIPGLTLNLQADAQTRLYMIQTHVADLTLTLTANPNPVLTGQTVTYTAVVTNNGPSTASNVTVTGTLPACTLGNISSGSSASCTRTITAPSAGTLTQTVAASATEYDPATANNTASITTTVIATGLTGAYYDNSDLTNLKLTRVDPTVEFNWGSGSPDASIGPNTFSVRWTGYVQIPANGTYRFYTKTDDGVRLWVNGVKLVDYWKNQSATERSGTISLSAGQKVSLKMEYYDNTNSASAVLSWSGPGFSKQVIPSVSLWAQ